MFASASLLLDQYAGRWIAMRTDACRRADAGGPSEASLRLRVGCLDARLSELGVLIDRLARADTALVGDAVVTVGGLGKLEVCIDDHELGRPTAPAVAARPGP